jgi:acetyl esterase/lipase
MLRPIATATALIALAVLSTACSTHLGKPGTPGPAPVQTHYERVRDQVFTPADWPKPLLADVYVPEGAGPFPAVLVIHGGGWESGDRDQVKSIAKRLASRGFVAVNVTYRLVPEAIFPAQLQDVQQAVLWTRANAQRFHIDPKRIGAFGYSAGAHLAALLGGIGDQPPLGKPGLAIQAVVGGGTPTDLTRSTGGGLVPRFLGGSVEQKPAAYRDASPINHVNAGDPPVFLYHGGGDSLVSIDHAEDYEKALQAAGVPTELYVLRGRGHIGAFLTDGSAVDAAIDFLDRYLRR